MINILLENSYIQLFIIGLIFATIYSKLSKRDKLNEPPLVYYRIPILGHTLRFYTDCKNLILESREKYGETFSLYVCGRVITVAGKDTTQDVLENPKDFNFLKAMFELRHLDHIFKGQDFEKNIKIIKECFVKKLKHVRNRLQKNIIKAIDLYINECDEPRVIRNTYKTVLDIIVVPIANMIVDDESCNNDDMYGAIKDAIFAVRRIFYVPPLLSFIHPWLHKQFMSIPFRFGWHPISKQKNTILKLIKPVVEKRLYDKKRLGDSWDAPLDVLQIILDDPVITPDLNPENINYPYIVTTIMAVIFASMENMYTNATRALYDLVERKELHRQELYQEALKINNHFNENDLKFDDLNEMVKLDSLIKETLRTFSTPVIAIEHTCLSKPYFTFKNNYQVPNGRIVYLNIVDINNDEELQGQNPGEFYTYRHLERNSSATKVGRNFVIFGSGKTACPGRFLAVAVIKMFLHNIMLKYDVRTEAEVIEPKRKYIGPYPREIEGGIVFQNRKKIAN